MSKTAQRKRSAFELGKEDSSAKHPWFRWRRHAYLSDYKRGFNSVKKSALKEPSFFGKVKMYFTEKLHRKRKSYK